MKKIILMFVVLITSIASAQTFDFGCESDLYSGDRPTELTSEQITAANGAGTDQEHIDVLNTAKFSNYKIAIDYTSYQIWVVDTDGNIGTIYARIQLPSDLQQLHSSLNDAEFQGYFLETIQAVWDLVNPNTGSTIRETREAQLAALVGQHNVTEMSHFESDPGSTPAYVGASYVQNGSPFTFGLSGSVGLIEDITDWSTKYGDLVAKLIADSGIEPTTHAHRAGVLTSYNSIDGISNIEVKVDNPTNLSVATVSIEWDLNGVAQDTYYFSATNPTVDSNGQVPGDLSYYEPGQFETNRERLYNKLIAHISVEDPTTHAARKDVLESYNSIDGISNIEVKIANEGLASSSVYLDWDLNGVAQANWYFSATNPTTNSQGETKGDLSALSPEQFETYRERLYNKLIDHTIDHVAIAIEAIYDAATPPTSFVDVIGNAAITANQNSGTTTNKSRTDFMTLFDKYGLVFTGFGTANGANTAEYANNTDFPSVAIPNGNDVSDSNFKAWALEVAKAIWLYGHPLYDADAIAVANALEAIYGAGTPPTELGTIINDAAIAVEFGNTNTPRVNFIKSLAYFNVSVSGVYDYPSKFSEAHLSNSNIVYNIGTNANTSAMTTAQFVVFTLEVVKRFWHIGHPTYAAELEAALRTTRITELEGLSVDNVNVSDVTVVYGSADESDAFTVDGNAAFGNLQTFSSITYGFNNVGKLLPNKYTELKTAVQNKVNELNPLSDYNLEKETTAFYSLETITAIGGGAGYGQQLSPKLAAIVKAAYDSGDNDVIEAFLKKLSKGAIHQGLDSFLEWYPDSNIIVTNNGGVSNGFYDVPITDNAYLGPDALWQLINLSESNVRHLTYHIMWNFWNLANQDAAALSTFRLQALVVKANSRGWFVREHTTDAGVHYYEPRAGADVAISGFGTLIVSGFQSNAVTLGDLTAANWETFYNKWVEKIDESN